MTLRTPGSTRTSTLFPYTALFRSSVSWQQHRRLEHRFEERLERLWPCGLEAGRPHRVRCQGPLRRISRQSAQLQCRASASRTCRSNGQSARSEEHTSELQPLMRISYAAFCFKKKHIKYIHYL